MSPPISLIRVGISACLLGEKVRYDGNHKYHHELVTDLGQYFQWVSVCPEVEMGLGVPREPMVLVKQNNTDVHLVAGNQDYTSALQTYAKDRIALLAKDNIRGFILKKGSPSCGLKEVPLLNLRREHVGSGQGLFVSTLLNYLPSLPVAEAEQLIDPHRREKFTAQVTAYHNRISS